MMRARQNEATELKTFPADKRSGKVSETVLMRSTKALIISVLILLTVTAPAAAQTVLLTLSSAPGGLTGVVNGNQYSTEFGTMNALALGTPAAGLTASAVTSPNGAMYFTRYQLTISNLPGSHKATVTGVVTTNFTHPAALIMQSCPSTATCTSAAAYSAMSTNAGAPTTIVPLGGNQTVTAGLGIFLPDNDGATAFTGTDRVRITLTATDTTNGKTSTAQIRLDTPNGETVQNAVSLTLTSAAGGLTVTPASDYSMAFGTVNGLGIGPGIGLTVVPAGGGVIYSTPYLLQPVFTDFTSTTATIKVFVSTDFVHPAALQLRDASASGGPYTAVGKTLATANQITAAAADRSSITRFLGLFVANINGPTAFRGSDNATLTFTLTVP
jgi:hypothetical protein